MVYWDASANEISLKTHDDSANTWAENVISASMTDEKDFFQMDGSIRHSDGHLIFAAWNTLDMATSDFLTWDITDGGTITAKADVITNQKETGQAAVCINQQNDDIYIGYLRGTSWSSQINPFTKKSDDGMATWGVETAMNEAAESAHRQLYLTKSIDDDGGRILAFYYQSIDDDLLTNNVKSIEIAAAAAPAPAPAPAAAAAGPLIANKISKASISVGLGM